MPFYRLAMMTKLKLTILFCLLVTGLTNAYAGWYECYHFKGTIDKHPITLFLQVRQGYFGEKEKNDFNVIGVYKDDKPNNPIRLEGTINWENKKALLYEISSDKYSATFEFSFSESESDGVWKSLVTNQTMPLHLNYVSKLIDTLEANQFAGVEILQANSLTDYYFVGDYSKTNGQDRAQMAKLKIMRKKDNVIVQTIDFSKIGSSTGNVMTIIFDNVAVSNAKAKELHVSNNIGRMGGYLIITFNPKTKAFKLNPNPNFYNKLVHLFFNQQLSKG